MGSPNGLGNFQYIPGFGFVEPRVQNNRAKGVNGGLRGDDSVMMISGLNDVSNPAQTPPVSPPPAAMTPAPQTPAALQQFQGIGQMMPWWAWFLAGILVGMFMGRRKASP